MMQLSDNNSARSKFPTFFILFECSFMMLTKIWYLSIFASGFSSNRFIKILKIIKQCEQLSEIVYRLNRFTKPTTETLSSGSDYAVIIFRCKICFFDQNHVAMTR